MALVLISTASLDDSFRISYDSLSSHISTSLYTQNAIGFDYSAHDYSLDVCQIFSASYLGSKHNIFQARPPVYNSFTIISPSDMMISDVGSFVPRRNYYVSSSISDDSIYDTTEFIAISSDYSGIPVAISTLDTIELATTSNVEPDEPPFPDAPPVGPYDMNRFRKTYTHVRVRPRIRKYSTAP